MPLKFVWRIKQSFSLYGASQRHNLNICCFIIVIVTVIIIKTWLLTCETNSLGNGGAFGQLSTPICYRNHKTFWSRSFSQTPMVFHLQNMTSPLWTPESEKTPKLKLRSVLAPKVHTESLAGWKHGRT